MNQQIPTASDYLKHIAEKPPEIVDVKVPSGFIFKFKKPNTLGIILGGELPLTATDRAAEAWEEKGVKTASEASDEAQLKVAQRMFDIRNRTLELSYAPKIVIGQADATKNEISTANISDADLTYLFKWTAAGGDTQAMLAMFPERPAKSPVARAGAKRQRHSRV